MGKVLNPLEIGYGDTARVCVSVWQDDDSLGGKQFVCIVRYRPICRFGDDRSIDTRGVSLGDLPFLGSGYENVALRFQSFPPVFYESRVRKAFYASVLFAIGRHRIDCEAPVAKVPTL